MTNWITVHSSADTRPSELDTTSSSSTVYERRNIRQETAKDELSQQSYTQWVYEERTYTQEEYKNLTSPAFQMLMQNISDLEVEIVSLSIEGDELAI